MIQYKDGIFCKKCGSLLQIPLLDNFFHCQNCKQNYPINQLEYKTFETTKQYTDKKWLVKKAEEITKDAQTIEQKCNNANCDSNLCYFTAKQIRSADEGQTVFYTCVKCNEKFTIHN